MNIYRILTANYFHLFGALGFLVGKSNLFPVYAFLFLTGILSMVDEFSTSETHYFLYTLTLAINHLLIMMINECIKFRIKNPGVYILLTFFLNNLVSGLTIYSLHNFYTLIALLFVSQSLVTVAVFIKFPLGNEHYFFTRKIIFWTGVSFIIGSTGLIGYFNNLVIGNNQWYFFLDLLFGLPAVNVCLSYTIYTTSQLYVLIRGINLRRRMVIRNSDAIFLVNYVGYSGGA